MKIDPISRKSLQFPHWLELLRNQLKGTDEKVEQLQPLLDLLEPSEEESDLAQTLVILLTSISGKMDKLVEGQRQQETEMSNLLQRQRQQQKDLARLLQLVTALAREQQQSRAALESLANQLDTPLD